MKKLLTIIFISFSLPSLALAQANLDPLQVTPKIDVLAYSIIDRLPLFLGALAVLAILFSGAMYVMAMGDPTKMETAKKNITWTIIGIVAVALVYLVIRLLVYITNPTPF